MSWKGFGLVLWGCRFSRVLLFAKVERELNLYFHKIFLITLEAFVAKLRYFKSIVLVFILIMTSCSRNKVGFGFVQTGGARESALSATADAAKTFDLSNERCRGENNLLLGYYYDGDRDGFGDKENTQFLCYDQYKKLYDKVPKPSWVTNSFDCDDTNPRINPDAKEICDDTETDEDCDGVIDPTVAYLDKDRDGYGSSDSSFETGDCMLPPKNKGQVYVFNQDDCDDTNPDIGPKGVFFPDLDGDGYGAASSDGIKACETPDNHVKNNEDCADDDASIQKVSTDSVVEIDRDCDEVDDSVDLCLGTKSTLLSKKDKDGDGCFGSEDCDDDSSDPDKIKSLDNDCDGTFSYEDCNDDDASNTSKITNEDDQDCDGVLANKDCDDYDEDSETTATDGDCDGLLTDDDCDDSDESMPTYDTDCDGVSSSTDCNDNDPYDKSTASLWYEDSDGDGKGGTGSGVYSCSHSLDSRNYVSSTGDACDDDASRFESGYDNDVDCDGLCDEGVTAVAMDEDCDGVCDDVGGGAAYDQDCDGVCDDNPDISSIVDKNCDGTCDGDTGGSGNDSTFDKNCDAVCDSDYDGSGNSFSDDIDCDDYCDETSDFPGNPLSIDADCDHVCDDTSSGAGYSMELDEDCDGYCDDVGTPIADDEDCDSKCDDCSSINYTFYEGSLVICPPGFDIKGKFCYLDCNEEDCPAGWADSDDDADCSWDPTNRCDPREYKLPCEVDWPHSNWSSSVGTPQTEDDPGSTHQKNAQYFDYWYTTALLVTDDFISGRCEEVALPFSNLDSLNNCSWDGCVELDTNQITQGGSSSNTSCPSGMIVGDSGYCEAEETVSFETDSEGNEVICPPGFILKSNDTCHLNCSDSSCAAGWADEDDDDDTDCSWDHTNRCRPSNYAIPCLGQWPMQSWNTSVTGSKTYEEGGSYIVYQGGYWRTNPMIVPDGYVCE